MSRCAPPWREALRRLTTGVRPTRNAIPRSRRLAAARIVERRAFRDNSVRVVGQTYLYFGGLCCGCGVRLIEKEAEIRLCRAARGNALRKRDARAGA